MDVMENQFAKLRQTGKTFFGEKGAQEKKGVGGE